MAHTLTLTLPDTIYEPLQQKAQQAGRTPEEMVLEWLTKEVQPEPEDPLLALVGSISCDVTDVAERHDYYIGQALMKEMRGESDS